MAAWRQLIDRQWQPKICSLVLLLSIVASILPIPTVRRSQGKDTSTPFPCQNRPCGCASAEQCRKQCCCSSGKAKLAQTNRSSASQVKSVSTAASNKPKPAGSQKSCCSSKPNARKTESGSAANATKRLGKSPRQTTRTIHYVIAIAAQKCHGGYVEWTSMPWAIVSTPAEQNVLSEVLEQFEITSSRSPIIYLKPPLPPPRVTSTLYS